MKMVMTVLVGLMIATAVIAETSPVQLSVIPDIALFDRSTRIEGLTLGIWSENPQTALALGIVNGSTGQSAGLSLAFLLNYAENYTGIQVANIANYTSGTMMGLQVGFLNYAGKLTGVQLGCINYAETAETGVQIGFINLIPENEWFTGLPNELAPGMIFVNWRF